MASVMVVALPLMYHFSLGRWRVTDFILCETVVEGLSSAGVRLETKDVKSGGVASGGGIFWCDESLLLEGD
eukprot:13946907-Ditylum_brightwellii.AAC.1